MKKAKWRQRLRGTCKWGGVTLCVLLFAMWLASQWALVQFRYLRSLGVEPVKEIWQIEINIGNATVQRSPWPEDTRSGFFVEVIDHRYAPPIPGTAIGGFEGVWNSQNNCIVGCPLWLPFLLFALPAGFLFWSDHRRRKRVGCCEECGYDMTGNTTGRCPECGAATAARAAST